MLSRVVPAISLTMVLSLPTKAFSRDDLPTFGWPMIANFGKPETLSSSSVFRNQLCDGVQQLTRTAPTHSRYKKNIIKPQTVKLCGLQ